LNIDVLVKDVITKLNAAAKLESTETKPIGIFNEMDDAIEAAYKAQKELVKLSFAQRAKIIEAIRKTGIDNAELFSVMAVEESKMGNVPDKIAKNILVSTKTPGLEDFRAEAESGDDGLTLTELSPFGVIGAITPTTNPTETVINNSIGMIAAGNSVVFSPHPSAKSTSLKSIELINAAIVEAGAPRNLISTVYDPSIEAVNKMISHPKISMLVATGGPGVVKAVLSSGKKAIGAGAGNPPALVDDTADIENAARSVVLGCSFDNNLPCTSEKEVIAMDSICDYLMFCMQGAGAQIISNAGELKALEDLLLVGGTVNKAYIGKSAEVILTNAGIIPEKGVKVVTMEVPESHPFVQHELMMPVLPVVRVNTFEEGLETAVRVEHGFRHTAIIHSKNIDRLTAMARAIQTTILVKNGPSYAGIGVGGQGHTTFTIAGPTGEGLTSARTFTRRRRCVLVEGFNIR
jgi:propionaldehyde dehydrogenase